MQPPPSIEAAFRSYRRTREPEALTQVYDGASARLLSVAFHLCKSPSAAEDVVQDTFLIALENPDRWDESKPLMPWLLGILSNRIRQVDGLSRRSIDPARLLVPDSTDPQEDYEAAELLAQVDDAITHLPQPYRGVVLLRLRNGLSPADISIALGRNPNTVRTQLARGVEMLRKVLPGSVAVLLAGTTVPAASHAASRQAVIQRAVEVHAQIRGQLRTAILRKAAAALLGTAVVGVLAWSLWPGPTAPSPGSQPDAPPPRRATAHVDTAAATPDVDARSRVDERVPSIRHGSATVNVVARGAGMPFAIVELEPLRDPRVFVHQYSRPFGSWQSIVPARPLSRDRWRRGSTAADGRCTFRDLPAGYWVCRSLGIDEVFRVLADQHSEVRLTAPANTSILRGVVLDPDGRPIADAPIWKLNRRTRSASVIVTRSDRHGRFAAAASPLATLGAFHHGFAPVAVTVPAVEWHRQRDVRLQFSEPGASLSGRVLDASGRPRPGAVVEVGTMSDLGVASANDRPKVLARMHGTITDASGRFAFPSLVPGRTVVRARGERFGVVQRPVELVGGRRAACDLSLPAEAVLTGRVHTSDGAPAEGVLVRIGSPEEFGQRVAVTDADGRYRLDGISPGRCTVAATDLSGAFACRELRVTAGQRLRWDAELHADNLEVSGQVVDSRGQPYRGAWVVHRRDQSFEVQQLGPDARFRFVLDERGAEAPGSLHVYGRDPRNHRGIPVRDPLAVLPEVPAGSTGHEIRLATPIIGGSLRGRVEMADGSRVPWTCRLIGSQDQRRWSVDLELGPDGSFEREGLEPGRYGILVGAPHSRSIGSTMVGRHGVHDLGIVRVPRTAAATTRHLHRFALLFPDRTCGSDPVHIEAFDEHGWRVNHKHQAAGRHAAPNVFLSLPAGRIRIRATTPRGLVAEQECTVRSDAPPRRAVLLEFDRR